MSDSDNDNAIVILPQKAQKASSAEQSDVSHDTLKAMLKSKLPKFTPPFKKAKARKTSCQGPITENHLVNEILSPKTSP